MSVTDENGNKLKYDSSKSGTYRDLKIYIPGAVDTTRIVNIDYSVRNGVRFLRKALEPPQQIKYPSEGMTPIRSDVLTPSFATTNPYDAVALKALAKGSVEYTLAYDAVFNEPGSPWFKMFEDAVYNGNVPAGISGRAESGIQSTLDTVKG